MASYFTLNLITQRWTHLWEDSLFFLEKTIEIKGSKDQWHLGTYARGSVLSSVAAFEASCDHLFEVSDFSKRIKEVKPAGIKEGIVHFMREKYKVGLPKENPYWNKLQELLNFRNAFAHGKCEQENMLNEHDDLLAAKSAIMLLTCLQHLYQLSHKDEEMWISERKSEFERVATDRMPLIDPKILEFQRLFDDLLNRATVL